MMALGDVAAKLGLPVFPCLENKRPAVETGFHAAATDPRLIRALFDRPNVALIGVPTGRISGLIAIDIDIRDGYSGQTWLTANADALPPTRTHKTRSGGLHLIFRAPADVEIRNSAGRIAPGVDVRGEGGYIIVPPSPNYQMADPAEPAEMPRWLIRACCKPEPAPQPIAPRPAPRMDGGSRYGIAALERECDAIRAAPFGQQEHILNAAGLKIGGLVAGGELEESIALADLLIAGRGIANQGGREPWRQAEVEAKLRRAFADGQRSPRAAPEQRPTASAEAPSIEINGSYYNSLERDQALLKEPPPSPLWIIREPWEEADIPQRPWVAKGYLLRGSVSVVSGPGSAGKSSLMVAWATVLSLGCAFDRFKPVGPVRVATYNVEDDEHEQRRRFSAMAQKLKLPVGKVMENLALLGPANVGTLLHVGRDGRVLVNTPVMDALLDFVAEFRPDVLMLDPFVELHSEEENDNTAVRGVIARFRTMAAEYQMSVVLLHHARKGAGTPGDPDSLRGASSIVGAARVALTLNVMSEEEAKKFGINPDHRREYFRLDGAKQNYAPIEDAEWFERDARMLANGDAVAIAWPWTPPNMLQQATVADLNQVLDVIDAGLPDGTYYSSTKRGNSNGRWVGTVVANMLGGTEEQAKEIVTKWVRTGLLYEVEFKDPSNRHMAKGVRVDISKRPEGNR